MKLTITGIPEDLKAILLQRVTAWEEPEVVTLPDGRKATATKKKYTSEEPLTEWLLEGVINNIMAAAPEYFAEPQAQQAEEFERQKQRRDAAFERLLKGA